MDIHQEVLHIIEQQKDEIINFLQSLIRIPSITGNEKGIQTYIAKRLEEIGLAVDMWEPNLERIKKHEAYVPIELGYENRPNVVGVSKGRDGGRSLLFNGHVDVIPAEPIAAWKHNPWKGEIENGRVYGRGASDMKGGLAAMTMALDSVLRAGIKLRGDVILEYVVDEEVSGHGTLDCILRGYKADAGISCEAGDLEVQPATTGSMWFEIQIEGKSASMSRIWEAVNAIEKGYRIFQSISDYQEIRLDEERHPLYLDPRGSLACFVGKFKSGTYPSSPPDHCVMNGRMGVLPNEDPKKAQKDFINYIHRVAVLDPWLRKCPPKIRFTGYYAEPAEIPLDHPICLTLKDSFTKIVGRQPIFKGHDGAADTRFLIKYGDTPTVIFGPGTITQMHATDEWIRINDLITTVKVLATTIIDWCK